MAPVPDENREKPAKDLEDGGVADMEMPDVVINAGSSDSEEDADNQGGFMGYEPLPQDINESDIEEEEDSDEPDVETQEGVAPGSAVDIDESEPGIVEDPGLLYQPRQIAFPGGSQLPSYMQVPELPKPDKKDLLWNQPRQSESSLDPGQVDKIRTAMSGFHLPVTNIPDWARSLTEDQWRQDVVSRLIDSGTSQAPAGSGVTNTSCDKTVAMETEATESDVCGRPMEKDSGSRCDVSVASQHSIPGDSSVKKE